MVGTLFNFRSLMTKGFQSNFPHMFNNKSTCPLRNCTSRDEQSHLLSCPIILSKLSTADKRGGEERTVREFIWQPGGAEDCDPGTDQADGGQGGITRDHQPTSGRHCTAVSTNVISRDGNK